MAKFGKGILDAFYGKLGTVVGSSWRGIDYMRSRSKRRRGTATPEQVEQQLRFSLSTRLNSAMKDLFNTGFRYEAVEQTGANLGTSNLLKNAITGIAPDFSIDFSKVLISSGKLPNVLTPQISSAGGGIVFTWTNNSGQGKAAASDLIIVAAYSDEENECVFTHGPATRSVATATLNVAGLVGKQVHTWISVISKESKVAATSFYTGVVTVQ